MDRNERTAAYERQVREAVNSARGVPLDTPLTDADNEFLNNIYREVKAEYKAARGVMRMEINERAPKAEGRSVDVNAPYADHVSAAGSARRAKAEFDKPMPRDASFADLLGVPESARDLSFGKYLRGQLTGNWHGAEREMQSRAMGEGTSGGGGALVPTVYSSQIVDLARVQTQVINAGAQIVPMSAPTVIMGKWTGDPVPAFRNEAGNVAQTDATVDKITFTARSLAGYTTLSREIIEDTDLDTELASAYGKAVAIAWDNAALLGNGTAPNPTGLKNSSAVTDKSALATNGATPTWDNLIDAVGSVRGRNEQVTGIIYHPRNELALGKAKDSQLRYLDVPRYLDGIPRLTTGTLPVNETTGTSSLTNSMFVGDFSQLFIGVRTSFGVNVYDQPAATTGQVLMVAWMRMDVQVGRGTAFAVRTGLLA